MPARLIGGSQYGFLLLPLTGGAGEQVMRHKRSAIGAVPVGG
jgi:hypothetical protein